MTGGDIAPLGRDAVTEMHKVFDWAQVRNLRVLHFCVCCVFFLSRYSESLNAACPTLGFASPLI